MSDDVDDDGDSDSSDADDKDGDDGYNDDGEVDSDGGNNDDNDDNSNVDVIVDDDNNGTMTIWWPRGQLDEKDAMAMGGQQQAERSHMLSHPSEAIINSCRQFEEEKTREREFVFGGDNKQKRVEVEAIEWRSLHLHSINSKPTFRPPQ